MKVALFCAAIVAILAVTASGLDDDWGTAIAFYVSRSGDYVVVAADSRGLHKGGRKTDHDCKLIALGKDTVFSVAGSYSISVKNGESWDANQVARRAYRDSSKGSDIRSWSQSWGKQAVRWFHRLQQDQLDAFPRILVSGGFLTSRNSVPTVHLEQVVRSKDGITSEPSDRGGLGTGGADGIGAPLVAEFYRQATPRARAATAGIRFAPGGVDPNSDAELVGRAVQFAIDNATGTAKDMLGGPVDIAIVRAAGIQWIKRKSECYRLDEAATETRHYTTTK
jgi:hypothetical protein